MKATTIYKGISALALGSALTFGASFQASALPVFQVTPSVLGGPAGTFTADQITGATSSLVTRAPGSDIINGMGFINFGAFNLNSNAVRVNQTGLNFNYGLFATFNYDATLTSGSFGTSDGTFNINNLNFQLFGYNFNNASDPTFVQATVNPAPGGGFVIPGSNDQLIGIGSLITGVINQNELNGTTVNTINNYQNTAFGETFFTAPRPFYNIVFAAITNTASGLETNPLFPNALAINGAVGTIDFNRANLVPEPGSLALIGLGLVGLFASSRRRNNKKSA